MNIRKLSARVMLVMMTVLLSLPGGLAFAAAGDHKKPAHDARMKPELAARREMVRKQQQQRITPQKRKAAVEALKAERLKVYNAKQAVKNSTPPNIDKK